MLSKVARPYASGSYMHRAILFYALKMWERFYYELKNWFKFITNISHLKLVENINVQKRFWFQPC
jgi:hypothetical protein